MQHYQENWGRPRDDVYGAYDASYHTGGEPVSHTTQPIVTGSSVIGVKFQGGVVIAADNLASYGSLRRFTDEQRVFKVGDNTAIGIGGDISDLQSIQEVLDKMEINNAYDNTGETLEAPTVHSYLRHLMYARRSKLDPLWNSLLVGGFKDGAPYLAYVDLLGVSYEAPALATGFGTYLAIPILRNLVDAEADVVNVTEEQARKAIAEGMKVLFYRDGRAMDKYTLAVVTKDGVEITTGVPVTDQSWKFAAQIKGFGTSRE